ncbi:MAG: TetR/AcrR family transcriptional regulator [Rhodoferax sp.]|nr:TetR/AcrR family transcriptional regulator [Rhodoferax sp.]
MTKKTITAGMRLDPAVRRQQILDAAISYFAEAGFGVQTRELSRRLGVSQPLLYRYFPSKQDLINAVFEAVFMSQWRNEWIVELQNRKLPLRDRLLAFYLQYAGATYRPEWIRIYMYAGLADMDLNRNYLALVRKKLLVVMCDEFRHTFMPEAVAAKLPPISAREIELLWTLHGGMFYWAIRRNIFNIKPVTPFETRTTDAIDLFLAGARELYPQVVEQTLAGTSGTSGAGTAAAKAPRAKSKGVTGSVS